MDKEPSYETFQFIETSNTDSDSDINHLLVLQEDGTLLSVNITEDAKEDDVQTCAVFDVSAQHFYVDVENTPDLNVPSVQYELQNSGTNIYSNSYLIQPETNEATEPMETDLSIPPLTPSDEPQSETDAPSSSKPANNFTEITLTDEQYHLLEQKGWVMLEFSERIFMLDTVGLHDITTNNKLIHKLRSELEDTTSLLEESEQLEGENVQSPTGNGNFELEVEVPPVIESTETAEPKGLDDGQIIENSEEELCDQNKTSENLIEHFDVEPDDNENEKKCDSIKIKTKYTFTDIPDKIFLGKTENGKKLYAKITKSKHKQMNITFRKTHENYRNVDAIDHVQFTSILQDYLRESPSKIRVSSVIAADSVVTQLMRVPHIKDTVMGHYVIVTKTVLFVSADGQKSSRQKPTIVIGEVNFLDESHGRFIHTPYLLYNIAYQEPSDRPESLATDKFVNITQDFIELVHIHITETKVPNQPSSQSINICNRKLSIYVLQDANKRHPNPIYACGACAAVFKTQSMLTEHSEQDHCPGIIDAEGTLTIDTDQQTDQTKTYYKLDTGKEKWYSCMQCQEKFSKLFNCKKHIQSHIKPIKKSTEGEADTEIKEYKCKMCPSKYFHASSLSKHIVKRHIQVINNISNKHT